MVPSPAVMKTNRAAVAILALCQLPRGTKVDDQNGTVAICVLR